jgi:chromosome segregation ATPase
MSNEQRREDIRGRIKTLSAELEPLLARVKNIQERISHLELDLREVLDDRFQRREFQTKRFEEVRELR